jgi:heme A synthase
MAAALSKSLGRYAYFALFYNVLVILWGVFLRASKSGDGCGQHWLTCNGEVLPTAPQLKTVIEFSHRIMSALDGLVVLLLLGWAIVAWRRLRTEQAWSTVRFAAASLVFVVTEALVGAGLVLTGNTAETLTAARPFWMAGHLINTFILLAFLTLTARRANGGPALDFAVPLKYRLALAACVGIILVVGISGSIAALSSMLFPSESLAHGLEQDFSPASNALVRLRLLHPISSIVGAVALILIAGWLRRELPGEADAKRWSDLLSAVVVLQTLFGAATLLTLGPIVMQIGHLLLADLLWISFVMLAASVLAPRGDKLETGTTATPAT